MSHSRCLIVAILFVCTGFKGYAQNGPPYSVNWINLQGVSINNAVLTRTATTGSWSAAGAISSNLLNANVDGWMEFTAVVGDEYMVGLAANNIIDSDEFKHGIRIVYSNVAMTYEEGTSNSLGNFQSGDVFRISREGSSVKYYKNGVVLRTVSVTPTLELKVKASLLTTGKSTPTIATSFDNELFLNGTATGIDESTGLGSISINAYGGTAPYTYSWSSGEQTNAISDKPLGSYTVTASDATGRTVTRAYTIGYKVNWINQVGVSTTNGRLTKTSTEAGWRNGAITSNLLPANTDGWIEFVGSNGGNYRLGLAVNNLINNTEFENEIYIDHETGGATAYERSAGTLLGNLQNGDVFRISREGSTVKYYRNGVVLRTVGVSPSWELKVKASLSYTNSTTPTINTSFDNQLFLNGTATGIDESTGLGSISINAYGGTAPYTYSWSSGEQTNAISDKPLGSYTVTASDAAGRTVTRAYTIGYKVNWINQVGVSTTNGRLTKTSTEAGWRNGAITSNLLPANTDGWIEFVGSNSGNYRLGLAVNNLINTTEFENEIYIDHETGRATAYERSAGTLLGNLQNGDVFRISREGSSVKYYRNGVVLRTVVVHPAWELKVKASLSYTNSTTPTINTSFDNQLFLNATVIGMEGNSGVGSISLSAYGGTAPYSYSWSSGEQTNSVSKPRGAYTVVVNDAVGRTLTRTYNIGYKINWINLVGVSDNNGRLTKTAQNSQWTSGAISSNILPANTDGWIEFVGINGHNFRAGLATNNVIDYTQFTNSLFLDHTTARETAVEGNTSVLLGNLQTGDVFRILREGNTVKYCRNGVVLRTVTVSPSLVLKVKACLSITNATTPHINTSFWLSDGIVRTYYSIDDGDWTTPSIWSLSENGPPSTVYPDDIDKVVIKGHEVTVSSPIKSAGVTITAINDDTKLTVDGGMAALEVNGNIVMNRENNSNAAEVLEVTNNGKLDVKNP